jgi:hypothetical protein
MQTKQSEGGPRRRSRAEVARLVAEFEASGLGRQEFCTKHGLSLSTLSRHRKRRQLRSESATSGRLVAVEIAHAKPSHVSPRTSEVVVLLSNERKIEVRGGFDPKVLQQLVRTLEQV